MQTIKHKIKNIHHIFNEFDKLYTEFSNKITDTKLVPKIFDTSFQPLINLFEENCDIHRFYEFHDFSYPELDLPKQSNKNTIVCFIGGN